MLAVFENKTSQRIRQRSNLLHTLRSWFAAYGYIEVQTNICVPSAAMEEHLEPIRCGQKWLHTSPEFSMKKILAHGLCRIYQFTPCFRGEEEGELHSQEFTMLEWYRVGAGTAELMDEASHLIKQCAAAVNHPLPSFQKIPSHALLSPLLDPDTWFFRWVDEIEPNLPSAAIIYDYPPWQAALARIRGKYADRFEIYLNGIELANAFHEELSSQEIRKRWLANNRQRQANHKSPHPLDETFLCAIDQMPRCAGIAMGFDRLMVALTDATTVQSVQF